MIKQHFVRGFERGARRDHTPNIGLKRGVCQVIFEAEDSTIVLLFFTCSFSQGEMNSFHPDPVDPPS